MDTQDKTLEKRSVTKNDAGKVFENGVIRMILPLTSFGADRLSLPPELPPYWTQQRDFVLAGTIHKEPMWAAAVGIAITKMASLSFEVESQVPRRAKLGQEILLGADGQRVGWVQFLAKHLRDFLCTDNGAFVEIVRATKGAGSRILGIKHLDSRRCVRTGDPEVPVLYRDKLGAIHELKDYQVFMLSDMPDPSDTYYGVGLCATSRAYQSIYKLASIEWYLREKVGGLHPLAIHVVNGILGPQLDDAVEAAKEGTLAKGVSQYMGAVIVGIPSDITPELVSIPLAELPDGFNRKEEFDISILTYANCLGLDVQDLQPLTGQALGTGAQSQVLADKEGGKGLASWRQGWTHLTNEFVMPEETTFSFSEKDYRDMEKRADVSKKRADVSKTRIDAGITKPEQEMQIMIDEDELPKEFASVDTTPGDKVGDDEKPDEKDEDSKDEKTEIDREIKKEAVSIAVESVAQGACDDFFTALKHLPGKHPQRRHGWRYGGDLRSVRRSLRGQSEGERLEYRRRAGLPAPKKREKIEGVVSKRKKTAEQVGEELERIATEHKKKIIGLTEEIADINEELMKRDIEYATAANELISSEDKNVAGFYSTHEYKVLSDARYELNISHSHSYRDTRAEKARKTKERKRLQKEYDDRIAEAKKRHEENIPETPYRKKIKELDEKYDSLRARRRELNGQRDEVYANTRKKNIEALSVENRASVTANYKKFGDSRDNAVVDGIDVFNNLVSKDIASGSVDIVKARGSRASMGSKMNLTKGSGTKTFIHEMGHWLEDKNQVVREKVFDFFDMRTKGERERRLSSITGNRAYRGHEVSKVDKFIHPYMGKVYRYGSKLYATEILSMGLEMFYDNPLKLKREDPEYFSFIFYLVRGGE